MLRESRQSSASGAPVTLNARVLASLLFLCSLDLRPSAVSAAVPAQAAADPASLEVGGDGVVAAAESTALNVVGAVVVSAHIPTERPSGAWPASTGPASNAAWVTGRQPQRLAEWPQTNSGVNGAYYFSCWKRSVLYDVLKGWSEICLNLMHAERRGTLSLCKATCLNDPRCAVWQLVNVTDLGVQCWVGSGTDCSSRVSERSGINFEVIAGQRLQHGDIFVVQNMSGPLVSNLFNLEPFMLGDEEFHARRCQLWCYSLISCEYWQYGSTGCWVDAPYFSTGKYDVPDRVVQYPLTTSGLNPAIETTAGEYLQHYCPPAPVDIVTVVEPRESESQSGFKLWLLGILVVVLAVGVLTCVGYRSPGCTGASRRRQWNLFEHGSSESDDDARDEMQPLTRDFEAPAPGGYSPQPYAGFQGPWPAEIPNQPQFVQQEQIRPQQYMV